jgi:hypothetical protein
MYNKHDLYNGQTVTCEGKEWITVLCKGIAVIFLFLFSLFFFYFDPLIFFLYFNIIFIQNWYRWFAFYMWSSCDIRGIFPHLIMPWNISWILGLCTNNVSLRRLRVHLELLLSELIIFEETCCRRLEHGGVGGVFIRPSLTIFF